MKFKNLEYFGLFLLVAAMAGFWPTYFSKFLDGTADFHYYFHFHSITALLWVGLLIIQPLLIRLKLRQWHRLVGKVSYALVPLVLVSAMLLNHYQFHQVEKNPPEALLATGGLVFIFLLGYGLAIIKRKDPQIHARGMIVAGMTLIWPATGRFVSLVLDIKGELGWVLGIAPLYILLLMFIYLERNTTKGRWVFPGAMALFLIDHAILKIQYYPQFWESFARWYYSLPLT